MTTIKISKELRKRLRILSSYRDITYEKLIEDIISLYEEAMPFKSENEFGEWFEKNLKLFGFKKVIKRNLISSPDYVVEDYGGKKLGIELELFAYNFRLHNSNLDKIDIILSAVSRRGEQNINNKPVVSLNVIDWGHPNPKKNSKKRLIEALSSGKEFSFWGIAHKAGVARRTASKYLHELERENRVEVKKIGCVKIVKLR